ncbi:Tn3 family transposase, partial [Chryseobacterium sp. SIMBA_029]|uniref:Tn3 family transposase n=1 Tax=Chryseobacterium sp. SIMBA_029 TaxID=3085772 RepID=UPI00397E3F53
PIIATDEASYSDLVFGLFRMLGYRFSPRISDIGDTRYWRAHWPNEPATDYGPLNAIARHKVNLAKIETHWPDMLRVIGSLVTQQVRAHDV